MDKSNGRTIAFRSTAIILMVMIAFMFMPFIESPANASAKKLSKDMPSLSYAVGTNS